MRVEVTESRDYPHSAARLWQVFTDPVHAASLDDRVALLGSAGAPGAVGSFYELDVAYGPLRLRQRVKVAEAAPPRLLRTVTTMEGHDFARQTAVIDATPEGCRVAWTVAMQPSGIAARRAQRKAREEVIRWLAAAEEAAARLAVTDPEGEEAAAGLAVTDPEIAVWNRACDWDVQIDLRPGDVALRDLIRFDGPAANGGPVHAWGVVGDEGTFAAIAGFRFFELHEAADVLTWLQAAATSFDQDDPENLAAAEALEEEANERYYAAASYDLIDAAFARVFRQDPAAFAPLG